MAAQRRLQSLRCCSLCCTPTPAPQPVSERLRRTPTASPVRWFSAAGPILVERWAGLHISLPAGRPQSDARPGAGAAGGQAPAALRAAAAAAAPGSQQAKAGGTLAAVPGVKPAACPQCPKAVPAPKCPAPEPCPARGQQQQPTAAATVVAPTAEAAPLLRLPWTPLLAEQDVQRSLTYYGTGARLHAVVAKLMAGQPIKVRLRAARRMARMPAARVHRPGVPADSRPTPPRSPHPPPIPPHPA